MDDKEFDAALGKLENSQSEEIKSIAMLIGQFRDAINDMYEGGDEDDDDDDDDDDRRR